MNANAYLIKGFLLGANAPAPILDAIDSIITGTKAPFADGWPKGPELKKSDKFEMPDGRVGTIGDTIDHGQCSETLTDLGSAATEKQREIPTSRVDEVRTYSQTMTDDEIAAMFGCKRVTVMRFRARHGINKPKGRRAGKHFALPQANGRADGNKALGASETRSNC